LNEISRVSDLPIAVGGNTRYSIENSCLPFITRIRLFGTFLIDLRNQL